ncbi:hypothetical protein AeNC1_006860 [Aphanomyces euteiches]|nr:hypothetical protein AeNC1_006860 [Aphanomyces euteiches]
MLDERRSPRGEQDEQSQQEEERAILQCTRQFYLEIEKEEWKFDALYDLYDLMTVRQVVVYCNSSQGVEWVAGRMRAKDHTVSAIHDEMEEIERDAAIRDFRCGISELFVTSCTFSNALLFSNMRVVVNYDLPTQVESYIDRFGPHRQFGRGDIAVNFVLASEMSMLRQIEQFYHTEIPELLSNINDLF